MLDNEQSNPTSTATNAVTKDSNSTPVTYQQIQSIIAQALKGNWSVNI